MPWPAFGARSFDLFGPVGPDMAAVRRDEDFRSGDPAGQQSGAVGRAIVIVLGSGEAEYEQRMLDIARNQHRLVFLCGYSETLADPLYRAGDLFLMPSSFEPCGISQMLAMRSGQPCVVHGVGGLHDTVESGSTGFVFAGATRREQAAAFVDCVQHALQLRHDHPNRWQKIRKRAAAQRFDWASSAKQYIRQLYDHDRD